MRRIVFLISLVMVYALLPVSYAEVPPAFSYQGILKDTAGAPVEDDVYAIKFAIYEDSVAGSLLWETSGFVPIQTRDGLFEHVLGATNPIPDSIARYDGLWVGFRVNLEAEMTPRTQLTSVPFALSAEYADTANYSNLANRSIMADSTAIADSAIYLRNFADYTYRRIDFNDEADSTQSTSYIQLGNTLIIPPGEISDYIVVSAQNGAFINGNDRCYLDIRIGENGLEISMEERIILDYGGMAGVGMVSSIQFYYEPTLIERANGFNVKIYMRVTSSDCWAFLLKCDVFGM